MLSPQELQLFESIARNQPKFKLWLQGQVDKQHEILSKAIDEMQMRRAQGSVQTLQQIIENLDLTLTSR